jgi:hypothetical protein
MGSRALERGEELVAVYRRNGADMAERRSFDPAMVRE